MEPFDRTITPGQRRLLALALILLGLVALTAQCACTSTPRPLSPVQRAAAAVRVEVSCRDAAGRQQIQMGSGVVVDEWHILTAAHVVQCTSDGDRLEWIGLRSDHRDFRAASVERGDWAHDVVRLRLVRPFSGAARLARAEVRLGGSICSAVRTPDTARYCGRVTEVRYRRVFDKIVDLDGSWVALPGNSGGALYDLEGYLVGLVTNRHICPASGVVGHCGGLGTSLAALPDL